MLTNKDNADTQDKSSVKFVKVENANKYVDMSDTQKYNSAVLTKLEKLFIAKGQDGCAWLYGTKTENGKVVINTSDPLKKLTKLEYAEIVYDDAIIHDCEKPETNETGDEITYQSDNLYIDKCRVTDTYNTLKSRTLKYRRNAKDVGYIHADDFTLEELRLIPISVLLDMMMFPFNRHTDIYIDIDGTIKETYESPKLNDAGADYYESNPESFDEIERTVYANGKWVEGSDGDMNILEEDTNYVKCLSYVTRKIYEKIGNDFYCGGIKIENKE